MHTQLPEDYDALLINLIAARRYNGHPVYGDIGSIYINMPGMDVYATPGWEGDWSELPIEILNDNEDGPCGCMKVQFTGNLDADYKLWHAAVTEFLANN